MSKIKLDAAAVPKKQIVDKPETDHPIIFADQLSGVSVGAFMSKFTVAVENQYQGQRVPVATIAMPTNALLLMALHIVKSFKGAGVQENFSNVHDIFQEHLKAVKLSEFE